MNVTFKLNFRGNAVEIGAIKRSESGYSKNLIDRNAENWCYYEGLEKALQLSM